MLLKVVTPPAEEPVSLAEAKTHLRIDPDMDEDDAYIEALISAAREYAEGRQRRSIARKTYELTLEAFESRTVLPLPPAVSVESMKVKNRDGSETTIASTDYSLLSDDFRAFVQSRPGFSYAAPLYEVYPVSIRYVAGYDAASVPIKTKQAILLIVGHWYENREEVVVGRNASRIPLAADALLSMDKVW